MKGGLRHQLGENVKVSGEVEELLKSHHALVRVDVPRVSVCERIEELSHEVYNAFWVD